MNIMDKKFDRLTVVGIAEKSGYVVCDCDCGNRLTVKLSSLLNKNTRSCGCLRKEIASHTGRNNIHINSARRIATNKMFDTNFSIIENNTPPKNNKSGYKGVWYDPKRCVYEAYIYLHKQKISLGRYHNIGDAVKARRIAEDKLFVPIIQEKNNSII